MTLVLDKLGTAYTCIHVTVNTHPDSTHDSLPLKILRDCCYKREGIRLALKSRGSFISSDISMTLVPSMIEEVMSAGIRAWQRTQTFRVYTVSEQLMRTDWKLYVRT